MLRRLTIANFRCVEQAELELDPRCTVFVGANGAGKTSILESVHVLSCGRSFRSQRLNQVIRIGTPEFRVVGDVVHNQRATVVGIRGERDNTEAHVAGAKVKGMADLAACLPLYVIDPNVHRILEDGPENRRRLMDRGLFHVEQSFVVDWRSYQRALKQRNAALKALSSETEIRAWEPQLIAAGNAISAARESYIKNLRPRLQEIASAFFSDSVEIHLNPGWSGDSFAEAIEKSRVRDRRMGSTTSGPHRADLVISLAGQVARQYVSRGQQKLLSAATILAQVAYFASSKQQTACLLLDDPAAELDVDNFEKLLAQIEQMDAQLLITGLEASALSRRFSASVFHVEQGRPSRLL